MKDELQQNNIFKIGQSTIWSMLPKKSHLKKMVRIGKTPGDSETVQKLIDATIFCCNDERHPHVSLEALLTDIIIEFAKKCSLKIGRMRVVLEDVMAKLKTEMVELDTRLKVKDIDRKFRKKQKKVGTLTYDIKWVIIMKWFRKGLGWKKEELDKLIVWINNLILDVLDGHAQEARKKAQPDGQRMEVVTIDDDDTPQPPEQPMDRSRAQIEQRKRVAAEKEERRKKKDVMMGIAAKIHEQMAELIKENPSMVDVILSEKQKEKAGEEAVEAAIFRIVKRGIQALLLFFLDEFTVVELVKNILKHIVLYPMLIPDLETIKQHLVPALVADQKVDSEKVKENMGLFDNGKKEGMWAAGFHAAFPDNCVEAVMTLHESMLTMIVERLRASSPKPDKLPRSQHDSDCSDEDSDDEREHGVQRWYPLPPDDERRPQRRPIQQSPPIATNPAVVDESEDTPMAGSNEELTPMTENNAPVENDVEEAEADLNLVADGLTSSSTAEAAQTGSKTTAEQEKQEDEGNTFAEEVPATSNLPVLQVLHMAIDEPQIPLNLPPVRTSNKGASEDREVVPEDRDVMLEALPAPPSPDVEFEPPSAPRPDIAAPVDAEEDIIVAPPTSGTADVPPVVSPVVPAAPTDLQEAPADEVRNIPAASVQNSGTAASSSDAAPTSSSPSLTAGLASDSEIEAPAPAPSSQDSLDMGILTEDAVSTAGSSSSAPGPAHPTTDPTDQEVAKKRGRGRPPGSAKKVNAGVEAPTASMADMDCQMNVDEENAVVTTPRTAPTSSDAPTTKRGRGRPPKNKESVRSTDPAPASSSQDSLDLGISTKDAVSTASPSTSAGPSTTAEGPALPITDPTGQPVPERRGRGRPPKNKANVRSANTAPASSSQDSFDLGISTEDAVSTAGTSTSAGPSTSTGISTSAEGPAVPITDSTGQPVPERRGRGRPRKPADPATVQTLEAPIDPMSATEDVIVVAPASSSAVHSNSVPASSQGRKRIALNSSDAAVPGTSNQATTSFRVSRSPSSSAKKRKTRKASVPAAGKKRVREGPGNDESAPARKKVKEEMRQERREGDASLRRSTRLLPKNADDSDSDMEDASDDDGDEEYEPYSNRMSMAEHKRQLKNERKRRAMARRADEDKDE